MGWFDKLLHHSNWSSENKLSVISGQSQLVTSFGIPEPTRSLIWHTDESTNHVPPPFSLKINISFDSGTIRSSMGDDGSFYSEPSLVWERLPIKKNTGLETKPMYYPSYAALTPEQRYQYLNWLRDITQPTNLSYVFLYYYGLERHLLIGDFDVAAQEALKLLKYHDRGTFRSYAQEALICSALYRGKMNVLKDSFLGEEVMSNEILLVRKKFKKRLEARDVMRLASLLRFGSQRYIKSYPDEFEHELDKLMSHFEKTNGSLLDLVPENDMHYETVSVFANTSLPKKTRSISIPQLLSDDRFVLPARSLLEQVHQNIKNQKDMGRRKKLDNKT